MSLLAKMFTTLSTPLEGIIHHPPYVLSYQHEKHTQQFVRTHIFMLRTPSSMKIINFIIIT